VPGARAGASPPYDFQVIRGAAGPREPGLGVPAPPPEASLAPVGLRLRPDPSLTPLDDGHVLLGGSPYRLLRLGEPGVRQVAAWWRGDRVPGAPAARALARRLLSAGLANPDPPPGPGPGDVTVVVPVRDRPAELARCLSGCAGLQIIVVDDGSADPRAAPAAAAVAGARCIRLPAGRGPGAARNAGLAVATTPFVAFVDSDCVPLPGWLDPLLRHFSDPLVAAVGPRVVAAGPTAPDGWLPRYEHACSALDLGTNPGIVRPGARVPYLPAAALVVRRAAAGQGFAGGMPVGEDVDFVWRLAEAGWHVRYEPAASVAHAHRVRLRPWFARRMDYGTSAAPLELRHPGRVPAVSMSGWSALAWLAIVAGQPAAGASVMAATTALLARKLAPAIEDPWPAALKLAGGGNLMAGRLLGSAVARTWWPLAVPAALAVRRARLPLAALVLAAPVLDWRQRRPPMDPARYVAARLLDDLAYSLGVWQGCLRQRTIRPLLPRLWWRSRATEPGGPA
jgi:mycofactocin glycosyltransferase